MSILSVACGSFHTMVHTSEGIYAFGSNDDGQLGLGDNLNRYTPTMINNYDFKQGG